MSGHWTPPGNRSNKAIAAQRHVLQLLSREPEPHVNKFQFSVGQRVYGSSRYRFRTNTAVGRIVYREICPFTGVNAYQVREDNGKHHWFDEHQLQIVAIQLAA